MISSNEPRIVAIGLVDCLDARYKLWLNKKVLRCVDWP